MEFETEHFGTVVQVRGRERENRACYRVDINLYTAYLGGLLETARQ
jgi:hypothetical protein